MNTKEYTINQDSTQVSALSSSLEQTNLIHNIPTTKPSDSQQLDPECLSPLNLPSFNTSSFSNAQASYHKLHIGHKLRIRVFKHLQGKFDGPYYPVSEDETQAHSASTSADTPYYAESVESAQIRPESEGYVTRQSSEKNISSQTSEENNGVINQETQDNSNDISEPDLTQAQIIANIQELAESSPISTATNQQDSNTNQTPDNHFIESLEFILEKTPIITIFMSLICLALMSGIAISVIDGKDTHTFLFIVLYVFLMYLVVEKVFKMLKASGTSNPTLGLLINGEGFYNMLDNVALIVAAIVVDLKFCEVLATFDIALYFLVAIFTVYCACARLSFKEKACGVIKRSLYIAQFLILSYKIDNYVSFSWYIVFCSGWLLLGSLFIRLSTGMIKIFKAFSSLNIMSAISKSAKAIGMMGLTLIGIDLAVLMAILSEACKLLDSEESNMESLKLWLTISQYLNACLLFFTTIAGADLLEFILSAAEHFHPHEEVVVKPKELAMEIKETYVLRMSSTYYKVIDKAEVDQREGVAEEAEEGFEENTCYVCCGNTADGVVLDCGHGGICFECLSDYIKKKDGCMECRKKVNKILRVESEVEKGKLFKGQEVWSTENR